MRGRSDEEIQNDIWAIKDEIKKTDKAAEFPISVITENALTKKPPMYYLGRSLEIMSDCDVAIFYGNWSDYSGCRIEHQACIEYGIPRKYINSKEATCNQ